jgi:hypothetical protein
MFKLNNILILSIGILFIGCMPKPYIPDQKPNIIFPTFNTENLSYKQNAEITVFPIRTDKNETAYVLKEIDYNKWKLQSLENTKDYNSLIDSIKQFNVRVKEKENEYNK